MMNESIKHAIDAMGEALSVSSTRTEAAQIYAELRIGIDGKLIDIMQWHNEQDDVIREKAE